jgi:DNA-binding CsgD family transcriptional regulator
MSSNYQGRKRLFLLLLFFCLCIQAIGQTQQYCDSLIQAGKDATRNKEYVKSLEVLSRARTIAEKNKWHKQTFWSINYIGSNYFAMMEYGEALSYCLEAYTYAVKELGPEFEMISLNNIAVMYTADKKYEKSRDYYLKAYETAKENNYKSIGVYLINLGNIENILNHPLRSRSYINEAMPNLNKHWPRSIVVAQMILAECDLLEGKTTLAREKAQKLLQNVADVAYNDIEVPLREIIAKSYLQENNFSEAAKIAHAIGNQNSNLEIRKRVFELLTDIYSKSKSYELALQYKDSVININTKLEEFKNGRMFENNKVKFEISNYKNQIVRNEEKLAAERNIFYSVLAFIIAIVTVTILFFRQKKLVAERNQQIIALELDKEKNDNLLLEKQIKEKETEALLEQERLKNEIESRNRKLLAKALYFSGRNELIEDILLSLSNNPKLGKDKSLAENINTLKSHLRSDSDWDNFIVHFEEVNHGFLTRLKSRHPGLTANDIRFIAYIYMNLSLKEIASVFNITQESARKRKERIASKMEVPDNVSIYDYISAV